MADCNLEMTWTTEDNGAITVELSPENSDKPLSSLTLDQESILDHCRSELEELYTENGNASYEEWMHTAQYLQSIVNGIKAELAEKVS